MTFATRLGSDKLAEIARLAREGKTTAQIAVQFRMSEANVRLALRRAVKKGFATRG